MTGPKEDHAYRAEEKSVEEPNDRSAFGATDVQSNRQAD
jgi:hypothetical protein